MEEGPHQDKGRPMSYVAVQTEQEQSGAWKRPNVTVQVPQRLGKRGKAPCVKVMAQQQWGGVRKVPEVTVQVQQQGQKLEQPHVLVQQHQELHKVGEISSVSVKVQQQSIESSQSCPCVTVQVQQESQEAEIPSEIVHLQTTDRHEEVPGVWKDQQARYKEGLLVAEDEHRQQDRERTHVIDSEPCQQNTVESMVEKCLFQQDKWDQSTEKLKQDHFLQTDQEELRLEMVVTEKQLYDVRQTVEGTKTFNLLSWGISEDVSKEATIEQQNEDEKGSNAFDQPWASSDEGISKTIAEKQKVYGHKKHAVPKRNVRVAPNYFVAIPVTNDQILDKIEDVQELIFTKEPLLLRALISVQAMHVTIIVAHLRTEDDVKSGIPLKMPVTADGEMSGTTMPRPRPYNPENPRQPINLNRAISALEKSKVKVKVLLQGKCFIMTFRGIGQFNNQVIYVKMSKDDQQMLSKIADSYKPNAFIFITCLQETVESSFHEMNIDIIGSKYFKPHLTFLKLSKAPALRWKGFRKISADLYAEYEDSLFGTEIFRQIDLCAMHKKKQDSGYYHCECSINIYPTNSEDKKQLQT